MRILKLVCAALALWLMSLTAATASVSIHVDMTNQTMHVESSSGETYDWPVSTAGQGYVTPHGTYRIKHLEKMHLSHKYHNSPMPHSMFFSGGFAIHGTYSERNLGRAASHGCVRISRANAATLYALVQQEGNARITLTGNPPESNQLAVDGHHAAKMAADMPKKHKSVMAAVHHKKHHYTALAAAAPKHRATMAAGAFPAPLPLAYAPASHKRSLLDWLTNPMR